MKQYGNALAAMSNEAVEYVRSIPVVKPSDSLSFRLKSSKALLTNTANGL